MLVVLTTIIMPMVSYCMACYYPKYVKTYYKNVFCVKCDTKHDNYFHRECLITTTEGYKIEDCCRSTSEKTRMCVNSLKKIQYIVENYQITQSEYFKIIDDYHMSRMFNNDNLKKKYKNFVNKNYKSNKYCYDYIYNYIIKKYKLNNENIKELVKEEIYKFRTGYFTKVVSY